MKFRVPGVIKIRENCSYWFFWSFLYVMKIRENWSVRFVWSFVYPGSWKSDKIEASDFFENSCTRVMKIEASDFCECTRVIKIIENWRKMKLLIFAKFHVPGHENWWKMKCPIFVGHENWKKFSFVFTTLDSGIEVRYKLTCLYLQAG